MFYDYMFPKIAVILGPERTVWAVEGDRVGAVSGVEVVFDVSFVVGFVRAVSAFVPFFADVAMEPVWTRT
jgi:hypothetical protein